MIENIKNTATLIEEIALASRIKGLIATMFLRILIR
jgi:hypothetical protein